jgi:hypothetical protein
MDQIERQSEFVSEIPLHSHGFSRSSSIIVEVSCDDRQAQLVVEGNDTVSEVRQRALADMKIMAQDPSKYIVIGANRQPVNDKCTVDELLRQGQVLYFRLIPQVAFGTGI